MNNTPIYCRNAVYAKEHNEFETFHASHIANVHCRAAIETAISHNFDGWRLNAKALDEVLEQFPLERVLFVLSVTVDSKKYDGRFSPGNKKWATEIQEREWMPYNKPVTPRGFTDRRDAYVVGTHPAILDGFVDLARKKEKAS